MGELQIADVREQVTLLLATDWENYKDFKPAPFHEKKLDGMLKQLIAWGTAMKKLRDNQ
jgi:hypothetical protein